MKKDEIKIGEVYMAKISNVLSPIRILSVGNFNANGFNGLNLRTNKKVFIRSAQKLRCTQAAYQVVLTKIKAARERRMTPVQAYRVGFKVGVKTMQLGQPSRSYNADIDSNWWRGYQDGFNAPLESNSVCENCGNEAVGFKSLCCEAPVVTPTIFRKFSAPKASQG